MALALILPLSINYYDIGLAGGFYITKLLMEALYLALFYRHARKLEDGKKIMYCLLWRC